MGRHALTLPAASRRRPYARDVLPDWLLWLLPVPLATLAAIGWASWSSRAPGPGDTADSVEQYARFRAALGGSVQGTGPDDAGRRARSPLDT